ncbi:MAG: hypothetical protein AAGH57_04680 [Pseudomonadota bacterium]
MVIGNPPLELAWPIMWAEGLPILAVVDVLSVSCACFAGLAFWKPSIIAWRIAFAMTFLMCAAVPVSLGAVNHGYHEWFWVAFVFIFLPSGATKNASRPVKMSYLMTFSTIQCLILMFYTMAGTWKVLAGIKSLVAGVPGNFSPHSLSWTLANRMAQTNTEPLLGPFMVDNPLLGLPAFWFLMYAQVASVFVAFRPSLHRAWAIALIAFHTGTFLLMEIPFPTHIAILALLFLVSPFQREDWLRFETLYNLPIFGDIARAVRSHSASKPVAQPQPETA